MQDVEKPVILFIITIEIVKALLPLEVIGQRSKSCVITILMAYLTTNFFFGGYGAHSSIPHTVVYRTVVDHIFILY